jgi:3-hydroxyacyl-[acyl-carrier-protein] dehydratase
VTFDLPEEVEPLYRRARREALLPIPPAGTPPALERAALEALLPHRDPFLLLDDVLVVSAEGAVARYDLGRAGPVLAGHFPGRPIWPGVLQVEAIGQAGLVAAAQLGRLDGVALTQVLRADFIAPVEPGAWVIIAARYMSDGLFGVVVGQCIQNGRVCSTAAVRAITGGLG